PDAEEPFSSAKLPPIPAEVPMRRIGLAVVLARGFTLAPLAGGAQQAGKVYRVGVLSGAPREAFTSFQTALEAAFRELGYVQGKNIALEYRFAGGQIDRLPRLATELVQLPVDVIVAGTNPAIAAAKAATTSFGILTWPSIGLISRAPK